MMLRAKRATATPCNALKEKLFSICCGAFTTAEMMLWTVLDRVLLKYWPLPTETRRKA